jgi:ubiquitin carboxyl-terminal hydrolase 1
MSYHQEPALADSHFASYSSFDTPANAVKLLVAVVVTIVTCVALSGLQGWPSSTKRRLWETFVYLIPSHLIYAMEFSVRRRRRRGHGNMIFQRKDFGDHQAKSEALQRVLGFEDSLKTAVQRARRLSGLDHTLPESTPGPAGLGNWDNSCYQNSIIQGLASLSSFDDYLAHNMEEMSEDDTKSTHHALRNIIARLNHPENQGNRLWTPSVLKSMNSWQQQDAQEYFSRIIDEVDNEIARVARKSTGELGFRSGWNVGKSSTVWQNNPFQGLLAQRVGCTKCGYTEGLSLLPFTCITVNLGMQWEYDVRDCLDQYTALESIEGVECIKCSVLRTKTSLEQVSTNMDLNEAARKSSGGGNSSPFSNLRKTVTERLQVIKEVCEADDFSDSGLYKTCNISTKSRVSSTKSKQAVIARAPEDLVIHVNRSIFDDTGIQRKNHARVCFPLQLNLNKWCLGSTCIRAGEELLETWNSIPNKSMLENIDSEHFQGGKSYELRAVITHYGKHENGHYIAYKKRFANVKQDISPANPEEPGKSWFCFSDDIVSSVSEEHVLSQGGVFMLFYEAANQGTSTSSLPAQLVVDDSVRIAQQVTQVASLDEPLAETVDDAEDSEVDSPQAARVALSSSDLPSPVKSPVNTESSVSTEELTAHSNMDPRPKLVRIMSPTPIMRTAGSLSPNLRKDRRSSNISLHSPSFVTAS